MIRTLALAIVALALMGMTTKERYPACPDSPEQYKLFVGALEEGDKLLVSFLLESGCDFMRDGMPATVMATGDGWVKIQVEPKGYAPSVIYTGPEGLKE